MSGRKHATLIVLLILIDAAAVVLALVLAFYLRIGSGLLRYNRPYQLASYSRMIALAVPIFLLICANVRLYDPQQLLGGPQEYAQVVKACTFSVIALVVLSFYERENPLSRGWLLMSWLLSVFLVGSARFAFRRVIFYLRRRGRFVARMLVVGANEQAKTIVRQFHASKGRGIQIVGFLDDYLPTGTPVTDGLDVLGSPTDLDRLAEVGAGGAVVVPDALAWESFQEIIRNAAGRHDGFEIRLSPGFYEILTTGVRVDHTTFVPLLTVDRVRITGVDAFLKNLLDWGLGGLLLVLWAPAMILLALAVWRVEGRPILDRHPVLGLGGRSFVTIKFRTGLLGSSRRSLIYEPPLSPPSSVPPTRLGALLFRTGLDKLPQLLNVLQGRMSLVGPRTISDGNGEVYGPWLPSMLTVKPGLTGSWAVQTVPTLEDEIRLTMYYIRNWTIWLDLQILFQTVRRVIVRGGSRSLQVEVDPEGEAPEAGRPGQTELQENVGGEWTQSIRT